MPGVHYRLTHADGAAGAVDGEAFQADIVAGVPPVLIVIGRFPIGFDVAGATHGANVTHDSLLYRFQYTMLSKLHNNRFIWFGLPGRDPLAGQPETERVKLCGAVGYPGRRFRAHPGGG